MKETLTVVQASISGTQGQGVMVFVSIDSAYCINKAVDINSVGHMYSRPEFEILQGGVRMVF